MYKTSSNHAIMLKYRGFIMIGERIRKLRKENKLSQAELANKIDVVSHMISQYENDKVMPSTETIIKIAKLFNVSIDYLLIEEAEIKQTSFDEKDFEDKIQQIKSLPYEDKMSLFHILEGLIAKNKFKALAKEIK